MKNKVRRAATRMKRVYKEPWTARSAKINVAVWSVACLVALGNLAFGLLMGGRFMPLWTVINIALVLFDFTLLKWSVTGLLWRKAQNEVAAQKQRDDEAFYALVMNEYKSR